MSNNIPEVSFKRLCPYEDQLPCTEPEISCEECRHKESKWFQGWLEWIKKVKTN